MEDQLTTTEDYDIRIWTHWQSFAESARRIAQMRMEIARLRGRLAMGLADNANFGANFPLQRHLYMLEQDIAIHQQIMQDDLRAIARLRLQRPPSPPPSPRHSPPPRPALPSITAPTPPAAVSPPIDEMQVQADETSEDEDDGDLPTMQEALQSHCACTSPEQPEE